MERRKFIKSCCYVGVGLPLLGVALQSCEAAHYATVKSDAEKLTVLKSEFLIEGKSNRSFVLLSLKGSGFPICLYKTSEDSYVASLLKCTHRGCELNVGGGIYSCPCHGSEFSTSGKVLEGPADQDLKTFKTTTDNDNIYIYVS